MNKRDYIYGQESKNSGCRYNSEYSRDNDSYSRKNNNSYKKSSKNNNQYKSRSRTFSNESKKESISSESSSSSYSDKSNLLYPYTINEIIKGKYRVNLFFLIFNFFKFLYIGTKTFIRWYFWQSAPM